MPTNMKVSLFVKHVSMRKHYSVHSVDEKIEFRKVTKMQNSQPLCEILPLEYHYCSIAWCENICNSCSKNDNSALFMRIFHTITQSTIRLGFRIGKSSEFRPSSNRVKYSHCK